MSVSISTPFGGSHLFANTVLLEGTARHSSVLTLQGLPYQISKETPTVGFDTRPKALRDTRMETN